MKRKAGGNTFLAEKVIEKKKSLLQLFSGEI